MHTHEEPMFFYAKVITTKLMPGMAPRVLSTVHLQVLLLLLHHAALSTQVGGNLDAADSMQQQHVLQPVGPVRTVDNLT